MRKFLIRNILRFKGKDYFPYYNKYVKEVNLPLDILQKRQLEQFQKIFNYSKNNIPYYSDLFNNLKLSHSDFKSLKDLEKIPILEKSDIVNNYDKFQPAKYKEAYQIGSTGGSTGEPMIYKISLSCNLRNAALVNRGFSYAGYKIGDKLATIAGASLQKDKPTLYDQINYFIHNKKSYSSYGMNEETLSLYQKDLLDWQPEYLRGYASSLALLADFFQKNGNNQKLEKLKGIFSTAEMLSGSQRSNIEKTFGVKVYNQYGLNDGGISAFEDRKAPGMLIDTERGIMEVVNDEGEQIFEKKGRILATSLFNFAFPFIRYNTNDIGVITEKYTNRDTTRQRLIELGGRQTDYLVLNGKTIGSPVLTVLLGKVDVIKYQIIQKEENSLTLILQKGKGFSNKDEEFIRSSLFNNVGSFALSFKYDNSFIQSNNKHKFIINLMAKKAN